MTVAAQLDALGNLFYPDDPMVTYSIARCYEELHRCTDAFDSFSDGATALVVAAFVLNGCRADVFVRGPEPEDGRETP